MRSVGPAGRKASLFHPGTHRLPLHACPSQGGHGEVPCKCDQEQVHLRGQRLLLQSSQWLLSVLISVWLSLLMMSLNINHLYHPPRRTPSEFDSDIYLMSYKKCLTFNVNSVYLNQHNKQIKVLPLKAIITVKTLKTVFS